MVVHLERYSRRHAFGETDDRLRSSRGGVSTVSSSTVADVMKHYEEKKKPKSKNNNNNNPNDNSSCRRPQSSLQKSRRTSSKSTVSKTAARTPKKEPNGPEHHQPKHQQRQEEEQLLRNDENEENKRDGISRKEQHKYQPPNYLRSFISKDRAAGKRQTDNHRHNYTTRTEWRLNQSEISPQTFCNELISEANRQSEYDIDEKQDDEEEAEESNEHALHQNQLYIEKMMQGASLISSLSEPAETINGMTNKPITSFSSSRHHHSPGVAGGQRYLPPSFLEKAANLAAATASTTKEDKRNQDMQKQQKVKESVSIVHSSNLGRKSRSSMQTQHRPSLASAMSSPVSRREKIKKEVTFKLDDKPDIRIYPNDENEEHDKKVKKEESHDLPSSTFSSSFSETEDDNMFRFSDDSDDEKEDDESDDDENEQASISTPISAAFICTAPPAEIISREHSDNHSSSGIDTGNVMSNPFFCHTGTGIGSSTSGSRVVGLAGNCAPPLYSEMMASKTMPRRGSSIRHSKEEINPMSSRARPESLLYAAATTVVPTTMGEIIDHGCTAMSSPACNDSTGVREDQDAVDELYYDSDIMEDGSSEYYEENNDVFNKDDDDSLADHGDCQRCRGRSRRRSPRRGNYTRARRREVDGKNKRQASNHGSTTANTITINKSNDKEIVLNCLDPIIFDEENAPPYDGRKKCTNKKQLNRQIGIHNENNNGTIDSHSKRRFNETFGIHSGESKPVPDVQQHPLPSSISPSSTSKFDDTDKNPIDNIMETIHQYIDTSDKDKAWTKNLIHPFESSPLAIATASSIASAKCIQNDPDNQDEGLCTPSPSVHDSRTTTNEFGMIRQSSRTTQSSSTTTDNHADNLWSIFKIIHDCLSSIQKSWAAPISSAVASVSLTFNKSGQNTTCFTNDSSLPYQFQKEQEENQHEADPVDISLPGFHSIGDRRENPCPSAFALVGNNPEKGGRSHHTCQNLIPALLDDVIRCQQAIVRNCGATVDDDGNNPIHESMSAISLLIKPIMDIPQCHETSRTRTPSPISTRGNLAGACNEGKKSVRLSPSLIQNDLKDEPIIIIDSHGVSLENSPIKDQSNQHNRKAILKPILSSSSNHDIDTMRLVRGNSSDQAESNLSGASSARNLRQQIASDRGSGHYPALLKNGHYSWYEMNDEDTSWVQLLATMDIGEDETDSENGIDSHIPSDLDKAIGDDDDESYDKKREESPATVTTADGTDSNSSYASEDEFALKKNAVNKINAATEELKVDYQSDGKQHFEGMDFYDATANPEQCEESKKLMAFPTTTKELSNNGVLNNRVSRSRFDQNRNDARKGRYGTLNMDHSVKTERVTSVTPKQKEATSQRRLDKSEQLPSKSVKLLKTPMMKEARQRMMKMTGGNNPPEKSKTGQKHWFAFLVGTTVLLLFSFEIRTGWLRSMPLIFLLFSHTKEAFNRGGVVNTLVSIDVNPGSSVTSEKSSGSSSLEKLEQQLREKENLIEEMKDRMNKNSQNAFEERLTGMHVIKGLENDLPEST